MYERPRSWRRTWPFSNQVGIGASRKSNPRNLRRRARLPSPAFFTGRGLLQAPLILGVHVCRDEGVHPAHPAAGKAAGAWGIASGIGDYVRERHPVRAQVREEPRRHLIGAVGEACVEREAAVAVLERHGVAWDTD